MTKTLAVATMVREDPEYLGLWLEHWRRQVPDNAIFVLDDARDPALKTEIAPTNYVHVPERPNDVVMDIDRWRWIAGFMAILLKRFDLAAFTDVDEFLVADPETGMSVPELLKTAIAPVSHAVGIEPIHQTRVDPAPLDLSQSILRQRQIYRMTTSFSKAVVMTAPVQLSTGGHFSDQPMLNFLPGLVNVHLRFADHDLFLTRAARARKYRSALHANNWKTIPDFRRDHKGAIATMDRLNDVPVSQGRQFDPGPLMQRMHDTYPDTPNRGAFYTFPYHTDVQHHRLPERFLDLIKGPV